jgi:heme exporter protein C
MLFSFLMSFIYAIIYLRKNEEKYDIMSQEFVNTGIWFGCFGMVTGMEWAYIQWGAPWSNDPKQVGAALTLLIYFAYSVLRNSVKEEDKRARLAAVYNIFSFALVIPLVYLVPAHFASLHPGSDNKPFEALKTQDHMLRYVSLPAMVGWILLGLWVFDIRYRTRKIQLKQSH